MQDQTQSTNLFSKEQIAQFIDHTLLKPEANSEQIVKLCNEAKEYGFFSVCVNSSFVPLCVKQLQGSKVKIASVVGFPLGAMDVESKAFETAMAIKNGASEIDMVLHIGNLKDKNYDYVRNDIRRVVEAAKGHIVKVIFETCLLSDEEKKMACQLSLEAGAHFVKTSTGFSTGGATVEDVSLMKKIVEDKAQVKASGGVRDYDTAVAMIKAGATRLGTSSGVSIVKGLAATKGSY